VKDCLTQVLELDLDETGAYFRALLWSWTNGPLPANVTQRARILGAKRAIDGTRLWNAIAHLFEKHRAGYVSSMLERERDKQAKFREKQAEKGRASAHARANRGSTVAQPRLDSGCPPVATSAQPEGNSALSDLRSADLQDPEEPRGVRRAPAARNDLEPHELHRHLHAKTHALIESGPPYVDDHGPVPGELVAELGRFIVQDLRSASPQSRDLTAIVDAVIARRVAREKQLQLRTDRDESAGVGGGARRQVWRRRERRDRALFSG
jgi:hypothetical protein